MKSSEKSRVVMIEIKGELGRLLTDSPMAFKSRCNQAHIEAAVCDEARRAL
jgi:hypothetical protein